MADNKSVPKWVLLCAALAALLSLASIAQRVRVEQRNRAVMLVVEAETVQELAASGGIDFPTALTGLKERGLGGVVLSEQFVSDLVLVGAVQMTSGETPGSPFLVTLQGPAGTLDRVERGVRVRFGPSAVLRPEPTRLIVHAIAPMTVRNLAIGLNPSHSLAVREAGLEMMARASNPVGVSAEAVEGTVAWLASMGARYFLPQGEQVLGRRDNLDALTDALLLHGMRYCTPEFVKIGGDANVVAAAPANVVRLHSAQVAELDKLPLGEAVDRYARAARERNMRALLIRPATYSSDAPLESFAQFVGAVRDEVIDEGGGIGPARPFEEPGVPRWLLLAIALAVAPVVMWVGTLFVANRTLQWAGFAGVGLLAVACWVPAGRDWMALLAAVAFPVAAYSVFLAKPGRHWFVAYLGISAVSLVGGLCVAGLLNGLPFLVKAEVFTGVKAAHFLPILLIGWLLFRLVTDPKVAMGTEIRWGQAFLAIGALLLLAFMAARTGNDNPAGVSGLETRFRNLMDALLFVRPRTKEFLIGHPLLIVGIALWIRERKAERTGLALGWAAVALAAGAIGQTSIVNTLCHLHTPVALGMARIGVGLVAGGILGAILWVVTARATTRPGS